LSYTTFEYSNLNIISHGHIPYTPASGMTQPAPYLGVVGNASDYLFDPGFVQLTAFIYPFLNSTDLKASANDPHYDMPAESYIPAGAQDGSAQPITPAGGGLGGNPQLYDVLFSVSATISNTGKLNAEEVPQLYISLGGPNDAIVALRGFERLSIDAGQSATFYADLTRRDLSNWDTAAQDWFISNYTKTVHVGASSRKLYLSGTLDIASA
jgi:beta-glucosidase